MTLNSKGNDNDNVSTCELPDDGLFSLLLLLLISRKAPSFSFKIDEFDEIIEFLIVFFEFVIFVGFALLFGGRR